MNSITENLSNIRSRIGGKTTLIAVSKFCSADKIEEAIRAGQRVFGENRVQEALEKWPALKEKYPDIELHLIGALQTNKVKDALKIFDVIEIIDRPKLAAAILAEMKKSGRKPDCYIQVNTGAEPQKAGVLPYDADNFIEHCIKSGLPVKGLMCIPPAEENPEKHFKMLSDMAKKHGLPNLSMGMSADFEVAIKYGATHVRVGTQIFGARG